MASKKTRLQVVPPKPASAAAGARHARSSPLPAAAPLQISGRWLLGAIAVTLSAAVLCTWGVLSLLFWQGSWQLLYHPSATITQTPASAGIAFDNVGFAATDAGVTRLKGWWIPAAPGTHFGRFTVLYLHGQNGNLNDTLDAVARLHAGGVNVLAFDYRGYGKSEFARPREARWREDAEWALKYLTETRHIDAGTIVLDGVDLGANLALEVAAAHPELAGVILESPLKDPMADVFNDARARMVPARLLVPDRYDLNGPASAVRVPVLWFEWSTQRNGVYEEPAAYGKIANRKTLVWLNPKLGFNRDSAGALARWLDEISSR